MVFPQNDHPQTIDVHDVSVTVDLPSQSMIRRGKEMLGKVSLETKTIVNHVSCRVEPGQLLAILGTSGSGKTSLLDTIACRMQGKITGSIKLNGRERTSEDVKNMAGYVQQSDHFMPFLTVYETLRYIALLRMPEHVSMKEKEARVIEIIAELGLRHVTHSKIGGTYDIRGISGGERRRCSIAAQLLTDPSILFADEPTSGLDSFNALNIVSTLSNLAKSQRTVLCTLHQPRSDIFKLFSLVMILSEGNVVYFGPATEMPQYFQSLGFPCSTITNPCDHALQLSTIDRRTTQLEEESTARVHMLINTYQDSLLDTFEDSVPVNGELVKVVSRSRVEELTEAPHYAGTKPSTLRQFTVLTRRFAHNTIKGYKLFVTELVQAIYMALLVGIIYWDLGDDQIAIRDRFSLMFLSAAMYPFNVILDSIARFCDERAQFYCERLDGLYDILPYFFARFVVQMPATILIAIVYSTPIYWMTGFEDNIGNYAWYLLINIITVIFTRALAVAVASWVIQFHAASFMANLVYTLLMIPAGFIANIDTLFVGLSWISNVSFIRASMEAILRIDFEHRVFVCPPALICPINNGIEALASFSMSGANVTTSILVLLGNIVVALAVAIIGLRCKSQKPIA